MTSLPPGQSSDCPGASEVILTNKGKLITEIHHEVMIPPPPSKARQIRVHIPWATPTVLHTACSSTWSHERWCASVRLHHDCLLKRSSGKQQEMKKFALLPPFSDKFTGNPWILCTKGPTIQLVCWAATATRCIVFDKVYRMLFCFCFFSKNGWSETAATYSLTKLWYYCCHFILYHQLTRVEWVNQSVNEWKIELVI